MLKMEKLVFSDERNLDRDRIHRLTEFDFIKKSENFLITGSTGVGKNYLATAIGHQACIEGYKVLYFNTNNPSKT